MGNDKSKPAAAKGVPAAAAKQPAVSSTVDKASQMKATIERLRQRKDFIEKKAEAELRLAKEKNKKGNKKGALAHLRRKKMYESEVTKIDNGMMNLEQQAMTLESVSTTADIVGAMGIGADAMKRIQQQIDVDDVADLQDNIREMQQQQQEIDDVIGAPLGLDDDADLEDELLQLEADNMEEELSKLPDVAAGTAKPVPKLPVAPTHKVALDDDEAALAELEAEMA